MNGKTCVKIEKERAHHVKTVLLQHRLLDPSRHPAREGDFVLFPVVSAPDERVVEEIGHPVTLVEECHATPAKLQRGTLVDRLGGHVPEDLLPLVPRSFNITGHVCILELDPAIQPFREIIARALCALHPPVKTVYAKASERTGESRTSMLELVHGPDEPVTAHVENGFTYHLDVKQVFFDPRLGNEHARVIEAIAALTASNEIAVLDAYCGVGPFVVPLSMMPRVKMLAVDSNPVAIEYLRRNLVKNKGDQAAIMIECMDAKEAMETTRTSESFPDGFNAIIMNLPRHAHAHLIPASRVLAPGGRIYWYTIAPELFEGKSVAGESAARVALSVQNEEPADHVNPVDDICREGLDIATKMGLHVDVMTRVKPYAPYRFIHRVELVHGPST